jgi:hypothetical protein
LSTPTDLLTATERVAVVPAIIPPDVFTPEEVVDLYDRAEARAPGRLTIGLGSSQHRPLSALAGYVDRLDAIPRPRQRLGTRALLAVGQFAVLDTDADTARETARGPLRFQMTLPPYPNPPGSKAFRTRHRGLSEEPSTRLVAGHPRRNRRPRRGTPRPEPITTA